MNDSERDDTSKESDEQAPSIRTSEEPDREKLEDVFARFIHLDKAIKDLNEKVSQNTKLDLEGVDWHRKIIDKLNNLEESIKSYDLETLSASVLELKESSQKINNDLIIFKEFMQEYNVDEVKEIFEKLTKNCENEDAGLRAPKNQMAEIEKRLSNLESIMKENSTAKEITTKDVDGKLQNLEKSVHHIEIFAENYNEDLQRIGDLEEHVRSLYKQDLVVRLNTLEENVNKYMLGISEDSSSGDSSGIKNNIEGQMIDFKESVEQCVSEIQNLKKFRDLLERDSLAELKNRISKLETSLSGENTDGSSSKTTNQCKRSTENFGINENQGLFNFFQTSVEQSFPEVQYLTNLRNSLEKDILRELRNRILRMEENYIPNLEDRICILEDSSSFLVSVNSTNTSWFTSFAEAGQLDDLRSLENRVGRLEESSMEQKLVGVSARVARLERLQSFLANAVYKANDTARANVKSANDSDSRLLKALEALLERTRPSRECAREQSTSGKSTSVSFSSVASPNQMVDGGLSQKETNVASILRNALCRAAEGGRFEDVRDLLACGSDVNSTSHGRCTALHAAALRGHVEVLDALVKAGAELDAQNIAGFTALHLAAQENKLECVQKLLNAGASPQVKSNKGTTPLEQALKWNAHEAAMELRAAVKYRN